VGQRTRRQLVSTPPYADTERMDSLGTAFGVALVLLVLWAAPAWAILRLLDRGRERAARDRLRPKHWYPHIRRAVRAISVALAIIGGIVLLTDWIDWPWWLGIGLTSPLGFLLLLDHEFGDPLGDVFDGGFFDGSDGGLGGDGAGGADGGG
jgi:hypothetical protein